MAIIANVYLPSILAQHLLTSFTWAITNRLRTDFLTSDTSAGQRDVEIIEPHKFAAHKFEQTWLRPTIRHRKLTAAARKMVSYGLGSESDILFCMIPAFSAKDMLPNYEMLQLISPRNILTSGWLEIAHCCKYLLDSDMRTDPPERYSFAAVIMVMDFLYLASQPYDTTNKPDDSLEIELSAIIKKLAGGRFAGILANLAIAYEFQRRRDAFRRIFEIFGDAREMVKSKGISSFFLNTKQLHEEMPDTMESLERNLSLPRVHQRLCRQYAREMKVIPDDTLLEWNKSRSPTSEDGELGHIH